MRFAEVYRIQSFIRLECTVFIVPFLLIFTSCGIFDSDNPFSGGSGTAENPYQVSSLEQLQNIADPENLNKHFIQVDDIDASSSARFNDGKGFMPIGSADSPFMGGYDGNGYTISELKLTNNVTHLGLFGYVKAGTIEHINLIQSDHPTCTIEKISPNKSFESGAAEKMGEIIITNDIETAGLLVGYNDSGGVIHNSTVTGRLSIERNHTGGITGFNAGLIENSYSDVKIISPKFAGGLAGGNIGEIKDSGTNACISTPGTAGGLSAYNTFQISHSFATGTVTGNTAGGLVALHESGFIQTSFSSVEIIGFGNTYGGLTAINLAEIKDSYSLSTLSVKSIQSNYVGGISGLNGENGNIANTFFAGTLEGTSDSDANIGGVTGLNEGLVEWSYWDIEKTGVPIGSGSGNTEGTYSLETETMTGTAAEQSMPGFDWVNIWRTTEAGYPVLRWEE